MQFAGQYEHTLDPKGRLIVAAKIRQALAKQEPESMGFWVTVGVDDCLWMYGERGWQAITSYFSNNPFLPERERDVERWFFANAEFLDLDKSGRCILPERLKNRAGISNKVIMVGVNNRVELWAPDRWQSFETRMGPNFSRTVETVHLLATKDSLPSPQ